MAEGEAKRGRRQVDSFRLRLTARTRRAWRAAAGGKGRMARLGVGETARPPGSRPRFGAWLRDSRGCGLRARGGCPSWRNGYARIRSDSASVLRSCRVAKRRLWVVGVEWRVVSLDHCPARRASHGHADVDKRPSRSDLEGPSRHEQLQS